MGKGERLSGLFLATLGALLTLWHWQAFLEDGNFYLYVAFFGPVSIVTGLGLTFFPSRLGWKTFGISLGCGLLNVAALLNKLPA